MQIFSTYIWINVNLDSLLKRNAFHNMQAGACDIPIFGDIFQEWVCPSLGLNETFLISNNSSDTISFPSMYHNLILLMDAGSS